jgi:hypothetical protein
VTKGVTPKKPSALGRIKALLIANPKMTTADIAAVLGQETYQVAASTIPTIRNDFRHTVRALQEAGLCRELEL